MVLAAQTGRNWKVFTYVACSATTFYSVFYATYNKDDPRDHCFTEVGKQACDKRATDRWDDPHTCVGSDTG